MGRTLFLHRDVAARSQHAEPPAQNGRGEATPLRPKTARESYSKARPDAARFRRSGGQRHPHAFLNTLIKRPCERYFFCRSTRLAQALRPFFLFVRYKSYGIVQEAQRFHIRGTAFTAGNAALSSAAIQGLRKSEEERKRRGGETSHHCEPPPL